ncbi:hypothetical protein C0Q70_01402 [Pomacea canaliculata]|uniref:WxxW domain-containing protein n=1 Tax=Pomacea canaliculata TaxID=400727 RepID=A0A2T7PZE4_POMCA|nr:hypothetical protein C0Q70_01402 [Pomacea canaliculata]
MSEIPRRQYLLHRLVIECKCVPGQQTSKLKYLCVKEIKAMAHWSQWFNLDDPGNGDGDFETLERIQEYQNVCPVSYHVTGAQCQFVGSNTTFDSSSAAQSAVDVLIQPCTVYGLICLNSMQPSNMCHDYRVRFMCQGQQQTPVDVTE